MSDEPIAAHEPRGPEEASCQLHDLSSIAPELSPPAIAVQRVFKLVAALRRRGDYLMSVLRKKKMKTPPSPALPGGGSPGPGFQAGDQVRVRSLDEIRATLDHWRRSKGCTFLPEMEPFCGSVQTVRKRVRRFLNETDYLVKKSNGIVLLENVFCNGTKGFGACDRSCFFFWREEWLEEAAPAKEPVDSTPSAPGVPESK
jgi:hypothetical protein